MHCAFLYALSIEQLAASNEFCLCAARKKLKEKKLKIGCVGLIGLSRVREHTLKNGGKKNEEKSDFYCCDSFALLSACCVRFEDAASSAPKHKAERSFSDLGRGEKCRRVHSVGRQRGVRDFRAFLQSLVSGRGDRLRRKDKGSGRRRKFCRLRLV